MKSPLYLLLAVPLLACSQFASAAPQTGTAAPAPSSGTGAQTEAIVPGPLRSFLRMAGISQKATVDDVLPLLARNVVIDGYHGPQDRAGKPTEFLILLMRYVQQARELRTLAGPQGELRITNCDEAQSLLSILGYRLRGVCGKDDALETSDSERAFLTIDSGFPLPELEEKLHEGKPFVYPFPSTKVPVIFTQGDWISNDRNVETARRGDVLDSLMHDRDLARLYWSFSRIDAETRTTLLRSPGLSKLLPYAPALDFYGSQICIRGGKVLVPGGTAAEAVWQDKDMVGANVDQPADFVLHLLSKDNGWLAVYFDSISRVNKARQVYFTDPHRLQRFYAALLGRSPSPSPSRPVFRPDPGLLLLATNLQLDASGQPHVPGGIAVWKEILRQKGNPRAVSDWAAKSKGWNHPEQLIEGMVGLSRISDEQSPLQIYLALSEMDRVRAADQQLSAPTVRLLADRYGRFNNQYLIFSEFSELNNESITHFLNVTEQLDRIKNVALRANAVGIFQANVSLWQIMARQGQISPGEVNASWQAVIHPFDMISSSDQLFEVGRNSLREIYKAVTGKRDFSQDDVVELLAGPGQISADGRRVRQELANRIRAVLIGQRLASFDTLFALNDGLTQLAKGQPVANALIQLAGELREFELPRTLFTAGERTEWAPGVPINNHTALQARTDLTKLIRSNASPKELTEARGLLTPFLRDTLVGLNYAYYEPPGAQMLHNNPVFVRSHDFSGQMTMGGEQSWQISSLFGTGLPAAGGAHLAGSLADLPFVLAKVEQDFIVPENIQALIWPQVVPSLLSGAVLPRWWKVTRSELHAATLYQRTGEELIAAGAENEKIRATVLEILSDRMFPERLERVQRALIAGNAQEALADVTPGQTFYLAAEYRRRGEGKPEDWRVAGRELDELSRHSPSDVSWERLSEDFGVPHPAMAQNNSRVLMGVKPFPAFMGYASRLLAESWDSNNLYWARLADEQGYSPVMLNILAPKLTHRMVEKIFASDFEDWPALLEAMRATGEEFRAGKIASLQPAGGNLAPQ